MDHQKLYEFLELVKPNISFDDDNHPIEPDYSDLSNWVALPEIDGPQFYLPDDSCSLSKNNNDVDVFYIHPTGFYEKTWNSNMNKSSSAFERTEIMLGNQASVFNDSCNIYAPEYRQATYYSFFANDGNGTKALDLAYTDVVKSFNYFIENFNNDRPFIIMGHSQGAIHAHRLICNEIQGTDLQKRMVCAYAIGYIIPEILYDNVFPLIPPSKNPNDTNCIISWSTVVEGVKRSRERTVFWQPSGWSVQPMKQKIVATNPFSWTNDSTWHTANNFSKSIINKSPDYNFADVLQLNYLGSKKSIGLTRLQAFSASLNSESGLVETKGPLIDNMKKMAGFTGDLHSFDVMLFWGSMRENIHNRINAFL